jgi:uncharacterized protein (DUF1800 family)
LISNKHARSRTREILNLFGLYFFAGQPTGELGFLQHTLEARMGYRSGMLAGAAFLAALSLQTPAAAKPPTTAPTRAQIQHLLRRMAFSATPQTVTSVLATGIDPWMMQQEAWQNLDDSGSELETLPTALVNGGYPDYYIFERAVYQHMILTPRQLQAKMELHWLDHFAVGLQTVGDPAVMYHYDQTVRANALGNFATLLAAVGNEPAMLIWLANNYNYGSAPNENFARESMQLYSTGIYQLNTDGSVKNGTNGTPLTNYSQADVEAVAKAMTGYGVVFDPNNNNPQTRFSVQYSAGNAYSGALKYFGKTQNVPLDGTSITYVMNQLAARPSTAPFEVTELLKRFVTENPSPTYISNVVAVWQKAAKDPDQLAQVMQAIVDDPEFLTAYRNTYKQPAELVYGSLRQLPGMMQATANVAPGNSLLWELNELGQQLFYPPTVFSFYRPGYLSSTVNTGSVLTRTSVFANITSATQSGAYTDTYLDVPTLRTLIGSTKGSAIAAYLLDALVDGGSPTLQTDVQQYLGAAPDDNQILGAIWLLLNSPDYAVN